MALSSKGQARLAQFALILAMVLWASSFIALKFAFRTYDPLVVIFGRMLIASICFLHDRQTSGPDTPLPQG